ncbi:hypothetical protein Daus18300_001828 [Diaporthe australafricana]|uniref:Uncharacterized protein n=1 Tax=Diaporthe australafricana TaxID=127596 RepID=A0ABR3XTC4_9PEZI
MTSVNELAARKAYLTGQLTAGGGDQGMLRWWREYKQVDKELQEAYAEAEAKKLQAPAPDSSTQESIDPAAPEASDNEADNEASENGASDKEASENEASDNEAPTKEAASDTDSKKKRRKVTFQLPQSSESTSPVESSDEIFSVSSIDWNSEEYYVPPDAEYESPDEINYHGFTEYMPENRQVNLDEPDTNTRLRHLLECAQTF